MSEHAEYTVLIVVAHPDDAEIGMGMKIQDHVRRGHRVHVHCLSRGAVEDAALGELRVQECLDAQRVLGLAGYSFGDIIDTRFASQREQINTDLFRAVERIRPDLLYTHYPDDQHLDHRITAEEALVVAEREVLNIRFFRSPYSRNFSPNLFFFGDIDMINKKLEALLCFRSQEQFNMHVIKSLAMLVHHQHLHHRIIRQIGTRVGPEANYAELFVIARQIEPSAACA